jgi:hypothetical protein
MGVHWYAKSEELIELERQFDDVERRIVHPDADRRAINVALDERDALFAREGDVRAELERRGLAVTVGSIRGWPPHVQAHVHALAPTDPSQPLLELLGWGADYYAENLRQAGVPMDAFSQRLDYVRASPEQARALGGELLGYAASVRGTTAARTRVAGLWLFLWGSVRCHVKAGQ